MGIGEGSGSFSVTPKSTWPTAAFQLLTSTKGCGLNDDVANAKKDAVSDKLKKYNGNVDTPYVLQQYKQARLYKGQIQTCQNLMYVSGAKRPDEFETRRAGATAMIVKGRER